MIDCTQISKLGRQYGNDILCQGLNELIRGQENVYQLLDSLNAVSSVLTVDSIYFFLGVICGLAFVHGVKMRL